MKSCREYPRLFIRMESTARRLQSSAVLENRDANIDYNRSRPPMTLERTIEYQRVHSSSPSKTIHVILSRLEK